MIVPKSEITFVLASRCRRLLLPLERGDVGELLPCPLEPGELFKLWAGERFKKGVAVTAVSVDSVDAADVGPAITAGNEVRGRAWLVTFVLGNRTEFFDQHRERYLKAKGVGLTADPERAARGEPAVTTEEELQIAARAREKRELEDEQHWRLQKRAIERAIAELRARNGGALASDLHFMERRLAKMERVRREIRPTGPQSSRAAVP